MYCRYHNAKFNATIKWFKRSQFWTDRFPNTVFMTVVIQTEHN